MKYMDYLLWTVGLLIVMNVILHGCARDDTDSPTERSGMVLRTDHGTGCQYVGIVGLFGVSITPRLRYDGSQVCSQ